MAIVRVSADREDSRDPETLNLAISDAVGGLHGWEFWHRHEQGIDADIHILSGNADLQSAILELRLPRTMYLLQEGDGVVRVVSHDEKGNTEDDAYYKEAQIDGIIANWLNDLSPSHEPLVANILRSIERLTAVARDMSDDKERLEQLLAKANQSITELRSRNSELRSQVTNLSDQLDGLARWGAAIGRDDPPDKKTAASFANAVGYVLSAATGGIIGNRSDAGIVWGTTEGWDELQPIVDAIADVLHAASGGLL